MLIHCNKSSHLTIFQLLQSPQAINEKLSIKLSIKLSMKNYQDTHVNAL